MLKNESKAHSTFVLESRFWNRHQLFKIQSNSRPQIIEELFSDSEKIIPLQLNLSEFTSIKNKSANALKKEMGEQAYQKLRQRSQKKLEI